MARYSSEVACPPSTQSASSHWRSRRTSVRPAARHFDPSRAISPLADVAVIKLFHLLSTTQSSPTLGADSFYLYLTVEIMSISRISR